MTYDVNFPNSNSELATEFEEAIVVNATEELEKIVNDAFDELNIHKINNELSLGDNSSSRDSAAKLKAGFAYLGVEKKDNATAINGEADSIRLRSFANAMYTTMTANADEGFKIIRKHSESGGYHTGFIVDAYPSEIDNGVIKRLATEEYVDNAVANSGGGSTPSGNITANKIVIGEGEAADLSIAGGTTDIDTYAKNAGLSTAEIIALKAALALSGGVKKSSATAPMSIALGANNESTSSGAIALGYGNKNSGFNSTAIGAINTVTGNSAFAYGYDNTINGDFGVAFGEENTIAKGADAAFVGGIKSVANKKGGFAFGNECESHNNYAVAIGGDCKAYGQRSFATGNECTASLDYSFACGNNNKATGHASFVANQGNEAKNYAFAEGYNNKAYGDHSHAEGSTTTANGMSSHTEGWNTTTGKDAEGAHAEGWQTQALHNASHAGGYGTITGRDNQTVIGQYNEVDENALFVVGYGDADNYRRNAFQVDKYGSATLKGKPIATEEYIKTYTRDAFRQHRLQVFNDELTIGIADETNNIERIIIAVPNPDEDKHIYIGCGSSIRLERYLNANHLTFESDDVTIEAEKIEVAADSFKVNDKEVATQAYVDKAIADAIAKLKAELGINS